MIKDINCCLVESVAGGLSSCECRSTYRSKTSFDVSSKAACQQFCCGSGENADYVFNLGKPTRCNYTSKSGIDYFMIVLPNPDRSYGFV